MEAEEQVEEDRKSTKEEEMDIQNSPDPPMIAVTAPINLPSLQSLTLPVTPFACEMPDCGAVSVFDKTGGVSSLAYALHTDGPSWT